ESGLVILGGSRQPSSLAKQPERKERRQENSRGTETCIHGFWVVGHFELSRCSPCRPVNRPLKKSFPHREYYLSGLKPIYFQQLRTPEQLAEKVASHG